MVRRHAPIPGQRPVVTIVLATGMRMDAYQRQACRNHRLLTCLDVVARFKYGPVYQQ